MNDREILNWLQEQTVDTIYLDDGRIIDIRGGNLRRSIEGFRDREKLSAVAALSPSGEAPKEGKG